MRFLLLAATLLVAGCSAFGSNEKQTSGDAPTAEPLTGRWVVPKSDDTSVRADIEIIQQERGEVTVLLGRGTVQLSSPAQEVGLYGRMRGDSVFIDLEEPGSGEEYVTFTGVLDTDADVARDTALVGSFQGHSRGPEEGRFRKVDALYY